MENHKYIIVAGLLFIVFHCSAGTKQIQREIKSDKSAFLNIGWATSDITPPKPVLLQGQFAARVSESVRDPLMSTALALESVSGDSLENSILISCDLLYIHEGLKDIDAGTIHEVVDRKSLASCGTRRIGL